MSNPIRVPVLCATLALLASPAAFAASSKRAPSADTEKFRGWIEEMKESQRGPFGNVRWFCADGTVLAPKPYACAKHGGGRQHGSWTHQAKTLRAQGYYVGNVLARLENDSFAGSNPPLDELSMILLERFLVSWDDGWILRGARSVRGVLQIEDEEAGSLRAVLGMLADPAWREPSRFLLLRETVRLLPLQADEGSAAEVRKLALLIAEKDKPFTGLRAKIHNAPDADDAAKVRAYAKAKGKPDLMDQYEALASGIDELYTAGEAAESVIALAPRITDPELRAYLEQNGPKLDAAKSPSELLSIGGRISAQIREGFSEISDPELALALLQTSLVLEDEIYAAGNKLSGSVKKTTRRQRLAWLLQLSRALYGSGLIGRRHVEGVADSMNRFARGSNVPLNQYRTELRYLGRVPEWSSRSLAFHFSEAEAKLAGIEPLAHLYTQDRMRGSPLLFYGAVMDSLILDSNKLAGIQHELFGQRAGGGLRALNPGLARGVLRHLDEGASEDDIQADGIYLLPQTISDLPSISGILTRGEGSSLSHVQLLARNLGIPNVVVGNEHLPTVEQHLGERVVLAVSPSGVVQLGPYGPRWTEVFGAEGSGAGIVIRPDLEKLDVEDARFLSLKNLRATDSGKTSGPKGANLGELKHYFGDQIPNGFVIPFGVFRKLLDKPIDPGGPSTFEWMKAKYEEIESLDGNPSEQARVVSAFLGKLRAWIETTDPGPEFRQQLRTMLDREFGQEDGSYGVFVRSDTNVEDLPGFTGAGLNLTLFNVVGFDQIVKAVGRVWASPFTERAYGWRQSHMELPEYVFPAVVVQYSFPSEKSGVMVTTDVEGGQPDWVSIAVSEGVGGAVDGQAAESLLVNLADSDVRYLAAATAPRRTALSPTGGIERVRASGTPAVLRPGELQQLVTLARDVPVKFPELRDAAGNALPADIEFAFKDGRLALLQIRPFVENKKAQGSNYLAGLDAGLRGRGTALVPLDAIPK